MEFVQNLKINKEKVFQTIPTSIKFPFSELSSPKMAASRLCMENLQTYETSDLPEVDQVQNLGLKFFLGSF